jgi:hypothetical protein
LSVFDFIAFTPFFAGFGLTAFSLIDLVGSFLNALGAIIIIDIIIIIFNLICLNKFV